MVSILMLTYNAPEFVKESIETVRQKTVGVKYELIVVDNASDKATQDMLQSLYDEKKIDKLHFNPHNSLFAGGNNIASHLVDQQSEYLLLLNSDICIKDENWLKRLLELHKKNGCGASAYGAVLSSPIRADGYCLLIDKFLYDKYLLDENYAWFWGVTKLESNILADGFNIIAIREHEEYIHHYGGGSGDAYKQAKGIQTDINEIIKWFDGKKKVKIIKSMDSSPFYNCLYSLWIHIRGGLKTLKFKTIKHLKKSLI